ncbi:MAG: hypothetical protein AAFQ89_01590 [Cyanobacteria bacterium J06626_18]
MVVSFKQFRDRYPAASLTSDLLMVQGEQFVVKVTIHTQAAGTVTSMAADATLEAAEDRARQRALAALIGIDREDVTLKELPKLPSTPLPPQAVEKKHELAEKPADKTIKFFEISATEEIAATDSVESPEKVALTASLPKLTKPQAVRQPSEETTTVSAATVVTAATSTWDPEPGEPSAAIAAKPPAKPAGDSPQAAPDIPDLDTLPAPVNLSDVIAQTDVELRRLGWSVADGREYLESTYDKRSRHDLTDEELLAFLLHLESLPDPETVGGVDR